MSGNDKVVTATTLGRNPIPVALICLGAAWLALTPRRRRRTSEPKPTGYFDIYEGFDSDEDGRALLSRVADRFGLSARGYHRILRVARTIADLQQEATVRLPHIAEAVGYRLPVGAKS